MLKNVKKNTTSFNAIHLLLLIIQGLKLTREHANIFAILFLASNKCKRKRGIKNK